MKKINIALLLGGESSEREVSIKSGNNVYKNLNREKYNIKKYDPKKDLKKFINDCLGKKIDLVLPILHGKFGEDGKIQGLLEILKIPFLFSDSLASALAMDKYLTKIVAEKSGLNIAKGCFLKKNEKINLSEIKKIKLPLVVKPNGSGSSVGISIVKNYKELNKALKEAFKECESVLIEEFISGRELTVPVFGKNKEALPVIEIVPKISSWFDYKAKYANGGSDEICPANLNKDIYKKVQEEAIKIFKAVGAKDLARVDFILSKKDKKIYFLEINMIPGLTKNSLTPKALSVYGISLKDFFDKLIKNNL